MALTFQEIILKLHLRPLYDALYDLVELLKHILEH